MTAISELRKKAAEKFSGFDIEFDNGDKVRLKSLMELTEQELSKFQAFQEDVSKAGEEDEEDQDIEAYRSKLVDGLTLVADDKRRARKGLTGESLALLLVVFEEYTEVLNSATKSEGSE